MGTDDLVANLVRDLELAGEADAEALIARWLDAGQAVAGLPAPAPPEAVQAVEAAGPPDAAVYTRAAQLQSLWLVLAGARAEYEQARASGTQAEQARLLKALSLLVAVSEEEGDAVRAALKAQSN
jgi:hypothetical protein